ncbi:para-aminobenzoate synthase, (PABA) [Coemansia javaensis]|uniref:aminodeoxychorismate synthase n=1 Tax=Coemansia javaensis TaxID=2761396 RepID=A0A9W8H9T4_9FUNG|nr:para-aminobenzoate synthase, (PABA) [Coemansia javaensis]
MPVRCGDGVPRTLLVDNYDSYTFNLLQLLTRQVLAGGGAVRDKILVIRNDQYPWEVVRDRILPHVDNIVVSPGPGSAERAGDFGVCMELIRSGGRPLLGVCLGHQGIALAFGAAVERCRVPVHGQISPVEIYESEGLFAGIPSGFSAVRYHSLAVSDAGFPHDQLVVLARASGTVCAFEQRRGRVQVETREIMALRHRTRPLFGVQFHPESVCSEHGARLINNFTAMTRALAPPGQPHVPASVAAMSLLALDDRAWLHPPLAEPSGPRFELVSEDVPLGLPDADTAADLGERLQALLHADDPMPLWLDCASPGAHGGQMSVMASALGAATLQFRLAGRSVTVARRDCPDRHYSLVHQESLPAGATFWAWMQDVCDQTMVRPGPDDLRFQCGWIGYFAYELKAECTGVGPGGPSPAPQPGQMPDAQLAFVDRCVVLDLASAPPRARVLALAPAHPGAPPSGAPWLDRLVAFSSREPAAAWVGEQCRRIRGWAARLGGGGPAAPNEEAAAAEPMALRPAMDRSEYLEAIERAKEQILRGESYEVCLTTQFRARPRRPIVSAAQMRRQYLAMRRRSPAPYGALLWFGAPGEGIASCSPERFLSIDRGYVEMKPIKGTARRVPRPEAGCSDAEWAADDAARARALETDVKERAENLMIVDLIRHDLNSVSDGSVDVPRLMHIESFARVHQMVSTVRARVRPHIGPVAVLAHCFPPGSMTGAPKRRTVRILDALENHAPRGVYSGVIGYVSAHGAADFSVAIRTAVVDCAGTRLSVGAGGALTALSDPKAEWAEVETKVRSVCDCVS